MIFDEDIPVELQLHVLSFLDARTLLAIVAPVSRDWNALSKQAIRYKLPATGRIKPRDGFQLREEVIEYLKLGKNSDQNCWEYFASTFGIDIGEWDVSQVTDFTGIFEGQKKFNRDIRKWDTSNATCMVAMFAHASSFNQDISNWNTSKLRRTSAMFTGASAFNQDLSKWNMSQVKQMHYMFAEASAFHCDLSIWNVDNVVHSNRIFEGATAFDVERHAPSWNDNMESFNDSLIGF
jgi:surface protein